MTHKHKYPTPVSASAAWKSGRHLRVILTATWHPPASPCFTGRANPHHTRHQVLLLILLYSSFSDEKTEPKEVVLSGLHSSSAAELGLTPGSTAFGKTHPEGATVKRPQSVGVHAEQGSNTGKTPEASPSSRRGLVWGKRQI